MLALSPSMFFWPLEDLISYEQSGINGQTIETNSDQSLFRSPPLYDEFVTTMDEVNGKDTTTAKKFNHNASERDRRKKINSLYSSLHSLLPTSDREQTRKLSIPSTIMRVVKYIPELRHEVDELDQKKEALRSKINKSRKCENLETDQVTKKQRRNGTYNESSMCIVSVNKLGDEEVIIHICGNKNITRVSDILVTIEEEELRLLSISSFESFGDRVFYNLHLQVQENQTLNLNLLRKKLS